MLGITLWTDRPAARKSLKTSFIRPIFSSAMRIMTFALAAPSLIALVLGLPLAR
jgi:hypothetical protein